MSGPPEPIPGQHETKGRVPASPRRPRRSLQVAHFNDNHMEAQMKHRPAESLRTPLLHATPSPGISQTLLFFLLKRLETRQSSEHRQLESLR